jgi:hypothetical protein
MVVSSVHAVEKNPVGHNINIHQWTKSIQDFEDHVNSAINDLDYQKLLKLRNELQPMVNGEVVFNENITESEFFLSVLKEIITDNFRKAIKDLPKNINNATTSADRKNKLIKTAEFLDKANNLTDKKRPPIGEAEYHSMVADTRDFIESTPVLGNPQVPNSILSEPDTPETLHKKLDEKLQRLDTAIQLLPNSDQQAFRDEAVVLLNGSIDKKKKELHEIVHMNDKQKEPFSKVLEDFETLALNLKNSTLKQMSNQYNLND